MPTLIIDGKEISVQPGATIMEAAKKLGVYVPHFCYHPKLSVAGNCRMCLVEVEKMPKPVVACAMPVSDGMVVKTQSDMAQSSRKGVMEFLLINHPLDCPVCDQGGACDLQDLAMKYGPDRSRYIEIKREPGNQDLGPLIETEMDRCIHCTRCIRFSTEIAGVEEMGATGRGDHMLVGTYVKQALSSELAGNLAQVCPVGALNDKPFHFKARSWEMDSNDAVCSHCSVGCQVQVDHLEGSVKRVTARSCDDINETWLCDKGRFAYDGIDQDRLTAPAVKTADGQQPTSWQEALEKAAELIKGVDASRVAGLVSEEQTNAEELYAFQDLLRNSIGTAHMDHRLRQRDFSGDASPLTRADLMMNTSLVQLDTSDLIILVGANTRYDTPILNLRLRKAARNGARVISIAQRSMDLVIPELETLLQAPGAEAAFLQDVLKGLDSATDSDAGKLAQALKAADKPVILLGDQAINHPAAETVRRSAVAILEKLGKLDDSWNGYNRVSSRASAVTAQDCGVVPHRGAGYSLVENQGKNALQILQSAAAGEIDVLFVLGADLEREAANSVLAGQALEKVKVIYLGAYANSTSAAADVVLPGLAAWEKMGTFTNVEGRSQRMAAILPAPGEAKEDWRVLRKLSDAFAKPLAYNSVEMLQEALEKADLRYNRERLECDDLSPACAHKPVTTGLPLDAGDASSQKGGLVLITETPFYHSDAVVARSGVMKVLNGSNSLRIHPDDAAKAKISDGGMVKLAMSDSSAEMKAIVDAGVMAGTVISYTGYTESAVQMVDSEQGGYPTVTVSAL
uniref:NADH-quinone oxidoreductase n=1 Tax=Magnetococcus massalia (strain MO-1) TaxID=451514 RepID=A0A1S7LKV4_MAGMO|nr:NADH:ubiquinone oxidoreductase, chain G [Candidatus Magnetococcus massalia]